MSSPDTNPIFIANLDINQEPRYAYFEITYQNFIDRSNVIDVQGPANSEILAGAVQVVTAWNTGTTDVLDVGDSGSANRYKNDIDLKTTGVTALVPTGYQNTGGVPLLRLTNVPAGTAPTAGLIRVWFAYITLGKGTGVQG